jgi:hypothetical protein
MTTFVDLDTGQVLGGQRPGIEGHWRVAIRPTAGLACGQAGEDFPQAGFVVGQGLVESFFPAPFRATA